MQWGYIGMVLSCWCLIISIVLKDNITFYKAAYITHYCTMLVLPTVLLLSSSYHTTYYLQLYPNEMPFAKPQGYVFLIGFIHIAVAFHFLSQPYFIELLCLLIASFFFSVDLYSICNTDSYMICRHYHYEWQTEPTKELLYNVIIVEKHCFAPNEEIQWNAL